MDAARLVVDEATITSHVKRIRRKFQAADPDFDRLATVHGAGYRWLPDR
jgi:two-component system OmpR family response regulator